MRVTRRQALAGLLAAAAPAAPARAAFPGRIVALDWGLASTLVALGVAPTGVGEPDGYRAWVGEPALPPSTRDVGLRLEPNLELLAALKPDLILGNPLNEGTRPLLERVAPVLAYSVFTQEARPLERARAMTLDLGRRLGREAAAEALLARAEEEFAAGRAALAFREGRRLLVVSVIDARHVNVYGRGSLFADVLGRLGLESAWARPTNAWGVGVAAIEDLAAHPAADLVLVEPVPAEAERSFARPGLWAALARARRGAVVRLPQAWGFGDVAAAARFAGLIAGRLGDGAR